MPPMIFGVLRVWKRALPGIDALGREGQEERLPDLEALAPLRMGRISSSVVPG